MTTYDLAATMSAIAGILKENWLTDAIQMQYAVGYVLLALLEKSSEDVDGLESVFTMRLAPNVSTGARGEMEDLPNPGRQTTKRVRLPLSFWYTSCAFSGQAIKASKNNATALAKVITDEMVQGIEDHKQVENIFMYGDGSGAIAQVESFVAGTKTVTPTIWSRLFTEGRKIQTHSAKDAETLDGMAANEITAVDRANKTITFKDALTSIADNHYMYLNGTRLNVNMGLLGICDDGGFVSKFQTLERSSYSQVKAKVFKGIAGAARDASENLFMDINARMREDGVENDLVIGTSFQLNDICKDMKERVRFVDPKSGLDAGISGVRIGDGKAVFTHDPDCPPGYAFGLVKKLLQIIEMSKLGFMDLDKSVLVRIVGKDAYRADLYHYYNLIAKAVYALYRVEDLNENRTGD